MVSKEETLMQFGVTTTDEYNPLFEKVKKAMDEYAKNVAIYFMEWAMLKHQSGNMDLIGKNSLEGFDLFDKEVLQKINK